MLKINMKLTRQGQATINRLRKASTDGSVTRALRNGLEKIGKNVQAKARLEILKKSTKSGRLYRVRKGGRIVLHRASARGEYPANMTGELQRTTTYKMRGRDKVEVGSTARYAKFLELPQYRSGGRPFLRMAIEDSKSRNEYDVLTSLNDFLLPRLG